MPEERYQNFELVVYAMRGTQPSTLVPIRTVIDLAANMEMGSDIKTTVCAKLRMDIGAQNTRILDSSPVKGLRA